MAVGGSQRGRSTQLPPSADDIAAAIIERHPGGGVDQMQLHKLLYLVQAAHLVWFGSPAFRERIEAWQWGPMVRGIAGAYQGFDRQRITEPVSGHPDRLTERTQWIVERILDAYGQMTGPQLAKVTKAPDSPWRHARGDLPENARSDETIPLPLIESHHQIRGVIPTSALSEHQHALAERFFGGDQEALADLFESVTGMRPTIG